MCSTPLKADNVRWDLSAMYKGIDDEAIHLDLAEVVLRMQRFESEFKGKLTIRLPDAMTEYLEIEMLTNKLSAYFMLAESVRLSDEKLKARKAFVDGTMGKASGQYLAFFELEICSLNEQCIEAFASDHAIVASHRSWLDMIRRFKPHYLEEAVEGALEKRAQFMGSSWSGFFNEVYDDLSINHKSRVLSAEEAIGIIDNSADRNERRTVIAEFNKALGDRMAKYSANTLWMIAGLQHVEQTERGLAHPMSLRNQANRIPDEVVDIIHETVMNVGPGVARRYYSLKAKLLGLDRLDWCDRNAPSVGSDSRRIPYHEGLQIVRDAYHAFSPTLGNIIDSLIETRTIHVPVEKGKQGGAYNSSFVLPGNRPVSYTLLNYLGTPSDVMTVAHELGHAVHGILGCSTQGPLMGIAPTAFEETASIFGETLTFDYLRERMRRSGEKKALLALLMRRIGDSMNSVLRQTGFSNFERRLHGMDSTFSKWEAPVRRSPRELSEIWLSTLRDLYGEDGDIFHYRDCEYLWAYIAHFHEPFYVYGYVTGELLATSIFATREALGSEFEPRYIDMLRSGSTKGIVELLQPFGLDPHSSQFWSDGIWQGAGSLLREAEALSSELYDVRL